MTRVPESRPKRLRSREFRALYAEDEIRPYGVAGVGRYGSEPALQRRAGTSFCAALDSRCVLSGNSLGWE